MNQENNHMSFKKEVFILILTIIVLIITSSIISYNPNDYLGIKTTNDYYIYNWLGIIGVYISNIFFQIFGKSSYLLTLFIFLSPLYILFGSPKIKKKTIDLLIGLFLIIWGLSILFCIIYNQIGPNSGGFIGGFFYKIIKKYIGLIGVWFITFLLFIYGISKLRGRSYLKVFLKKLLFKIKIISKKELIKDPNIKFIEKKKIITEDSLPPFLTIIKENEISKTNKINIIKNNKEKILDQSLEINDNHNEIDKKNINSEESKLQQVNEEIIQNLENDFTKIKEKLESYTQNTNNKEKNKTQNYDLINISNKDMLTNFTNNIIDSNSSLKAELSEEEEIDIEIETDEIDFTQTPGDIQQLINNIEIKEKLSLPFYNNQFDNENNNISFSQKQKQETVDNNPFKNYKKPPIDFLFYSEEKNIEESKEEINETAKKIIETLKEFKIELTKLICCYRGPVLTRYEFETAPGIKMEKIERYSNNIAYSLASTKVRIIAPVPGKQAIGVEVPNKIRKDVLLGDILRSKEYKETKGKLPLALGKDISGKPIIADLSTMPHLLIAGTTGSGKSVCINSVLFSLLYNKRPEELRLILIDPKRVELKAFSDIPHLLTPIVTDPKYAAMALNWAVNEMERRYELLEELGTRDIKSYNEKVEEIKINNKITDYELLHYIVIIIDELADLMLIAKKEIENVVARLAAKSRAAGIHLIFATQSPRADIITGIIKANFQPRIAFAVATKMESRIILDASGADKLLGKGDMLFYQPGYKELGIPIRVQGAFVSDKEVYKITDFLRATCNPQYIQEILEEEENENIIESLSPSDEPIYHEAVRIVVEEKKASASYLQRRLQIGYNRAARMIEYMESEGIIGKAQGSKPREVLIDSYPY